MNWDKNRQDKKRTRDEKRMRGDDKYGKTGHKDSDRREKTRAKNY